MKKLVLVISIITSSWIFVCGQNYQLEGEGVDAKVSLLWSVDKWPDNLQGVFIKRRSINKSGKKSEWVILNQDLLTIGNSKTKELSNISNNMDLVKEIEVKREKLLTNNEKKGTKIKEINQEELQGHLKDAEAVKMISLLFYFDFDVALLYGFAYVDMNVPKAHAYEYGLFPVLNGVAANSPTTTFEWKYGDEPDLSVKVKKGKIRSRLKKVQLTWVFDAEDFDKKTNIAGFNLYRKSQVGKIEKLNPVVIWIDKSSTKRALYFNDIVEDLEKEYTYSAVPVSIFKNEGKKYELKYNPKVHDSIAPPVLSSNVKLGEDFISSGVGLSWEFEPKKESQILGFVVERRILPNTVYKVVSDTIPPSEREFMDKDLPKEKGNNFHYRVSALQDESYPLSSNVLRLFYNPQPDFSLSKLSAVPKLEGRNVFVELKWAGKEKNFNLAKGYGIFADHSGGILAYEQDIEPIKGFKFNYRIEGATGKDYLFAVAVVDKDGQPTIVTDTVKVTIPTTSLPFISIWPISSANQKVTIDWKYPDNIVDLLGFRVYNNDTIFADEKALGKELRTWTTGELEPGEYNLQIEAVTNFGITSRRSKKMKITVKPKS